MDCKALRRLQAGSQAHSLVNRALCIELLRFLGTPDNADINP